ncbi:YdbL family protein [Pluralibacter gergoviae]|uniref:YdbL family protein n=2 Tax=Pluralibacter gergoviae TaxID=61647 RepID=A0AAI9DF53_PLUGE|nr:YdbL family protein [Pluralibacter gergoviae]EKV0914173.1 YdbL family protein [Pluralibacter gergoviae]EKV9908361.1 YdbL family protein [Pluralibacter gergoviae]EKW7272272.1 YdbL family protein [Pluralibacter gergoviae]ELD4294122.1 YdbL family protein [Pluralibacter gergoviae]ELD4304901.1 YdbL family protein [Pluralibacter gergoviae]
MKRIAIAALLALVCQSAQALTLEQARAEGRVGETLSGYLAPVAQDADTQALVARINAARSASYQQLASQNNVPVNEVAKMAGQKLVARAQPGEYVRGLNGQWLKKE